MELPAPDRLVVTGEFEGSLIEVALRRLDAGNSPLLSREFRWINESPFNR